jgi:hypothetical protein
MFQTTTVTREKIENLIRRIFEIENARPTKTVEETIAGIDALMASTVEGWTNGKHCPNRSVEREFERGLFGALEDYHRKIERVIVEPPFASLEWRLTSVKHHLEILGCSIWEVNEAGMMARYWIYLDPAPFIKIGLI